MKHFSYNIIFPLKISTHHQILVNYKNQSIANEIAAHC